MRGDAGIALIHRIVNSMGFVWNAIHFEAGIDGLIEIRDDVTAEVTNFIIQVQSKAGPSHFRNETDSTFDYYCDDRDLKYWLDGNAPVVLVVSRPDRDEAYWISVKEYFKDPLKRKAKKVTFNKVDDAFGVGCRERLAALAVSPNSGFYLSALPQTESLTSNLMPIVEYPKRLFRASTKMRVNAQVWDALYEAETDSPSEWLLHDGFIYSFHDLTFDRWAKACIGSTTENLPTNDWAHSDDPNKKYAFLRLLKICTEQILYRQGIRFSRNKELYFFRSTPDFSERKVGGLSVFKGYESKTTADRIAYYRHRAMEARFLRFDRCWYIEITPSYYFTQDGFRLSRFYEERLSQIKQIERQNHGHLRQVKLWEEVLLQVHLRTKFRRTKQKSLFLGDAQAIEPQPHQLYEYIKFGALLDFEVDWAVPESAWLFGVEPDAEEEGDPDQRRLFD